MAYINKGRRLMVFLAGQPLALATNHTLSISPSILEDRTKDDGDAPVAEFDNYTWSLTTDSIIGINDENVELSIVAFIEAMLAMDSVSLVFDAASPAIGSLPNSGWSPSNNAEDYPSTRGEAWIESISISSGSTGYATASITFKGKGKLS